MGLADVPCVCWFRKEIVLPDPLPAGPASIHLGWIEKMDTTYINGHWVGASSWVEHDRDYDVPREDLKPGTNLVALSMFKLKSKDSFLSKPDEMRLVVGDTAVPLAGEWKGKLSFNAKPPHPMPLDFENYPTMPAVLYLGMIDPVAPLAIKGAIWYQGEANFTQAYRYRTLLPAMIGNWRDLFGQGDFPFYIVGLPAFMERRSEPGTDGWAELREAQALTAQNVPNCGAGRHGGHRRRRQHSSEKQSPRGRSPGLLCVGRNLWRKDSLSRSDLCFPEAPARSVETQLRPCRRRIGRQGRQTG